MKQDVVKKKASYPEELTEMQRRFCEYLIMNEGRTTRKEAAIKAGYAENAVPTCQAGPNAMGKAAIQIAKAPESTTRCLPRNLLNQN